MRACVLWPFRKGGPDSSCRAVAQRTRELQTKVRSVVKDARHVIDQRSNQRPATSQRTGEDDAKGPRGSRRGGGARHGRAHATRSGNHATRPSTSSGAEQSELVARQDPNLALLKREMRSHIATVRAQGWSEDQHAAALAQKTAWMGNATEKRGAF